MNEAIIQGVNMCLTTGLSITATLHRFQTWEKVCDATIYGVDVFTKEGRAVIRL